MKPELLAAVSDAPDDDGPRLVLADLLQERGDPWGELIQLDCRVHALPRHHADRPELARRRAEVLAAGIMARVPSGGTWRGILRRGFLERLELADERSPLGAFGPLALCRELAVDFTESSWLYLALEHGVQERLEGLRLIFPPALTADVGHHLLARLDERLPRLRRLHLHADDSNLWGRVQRTATWSRLTDLTVAGRVAEVWLARHLAEAPVESLTIIGGLSAGALRAVLAAAPRLVSLELHDLAGASPDLLAVLAEAELPALRRLRLVGLHDAALAGILGAPKRASLREARFRVPTSRVEELERALAAAAPPGLDLEVATLSPARSRHHLGFDDDDERDLRGITQGVLDRAFPVPVPEMPMPPTNYFGPFIPGPPAPEPAKKKRRWWPW